jgi:hypothetical protein
MTLSIERGRGDSSQFTENRDYKPFKMAHLHPEVAYYRRRRAKGGRHDRI